MTAGNWKIAHVHGHHVEHKIDLLPGRDYVRYFQVNPNASPCCFSAIGHALRTAPLQWIVPVRVMLRESFRGHHFRRKFYRFYLLEFVLVYGLVLAIAFTQPVKALFYFGVIYSLVFIESRHVDYVTHVASRSDSRLGFANVCLHPKYNRLLWNFGFHIAHHMQPRAHWTALPSIYHELDAEEQPVPVARTVNYFGGFSPASFRWHRIKQSGRLR
jgi:fatty acid desaturase